MKFFLPHKRIVPDKLRVFMEVPRITGGFSLTSRLGNAVCCAFSPVVYNQQALTNKFAGLIMILSAIILRFIVETKGVKSNYFRSDLAIFRKNYSREKKWKM